MLEPINNASLRQAKNMMEMILPPGQVEAINAMIEAAKAAFPERFEQPQSHSKQHAA